MTEPVQESPLSMTDRSAPRAAPSDAHCAAPPLHIAGQMRQGSAAALLGSGPQNCQYDNCIHFDLFSVFARRASTRCLARGR